MYFLGTYNEIQKHVIFWRFSTQKKLFKNKTKTNKTASFQHFRFSPRIEPSHIEVVGSWVGSWSGNTAWFSPLSRGEETTVDAAGFGFKKDSV